MAIRSNLSFKIASHAPNFVAISQGAVFRRFSPSFYKSNGSNQPLTGRHIRLLSTKQKEDSRSQKKTKKISFGVWLVLGLSATGFAFSRLNSLKPQAPTLNSEIATPKEKTKRSFTVQTVDNQNLHRSKGDIIILIGIVAAGKSSITRAVKTVDPGFFEEDLDLRRDPETPTTPEIEMQMIDDTIDRSLQGGKTVISLLDAEKLKKRAQERGITGLPVKSILLHCPFAEIPDRLEARNRVALSSEGNLKDYRDPVVPLEQFSRLYLNQANGGEAIDRIQASEYFDSSFDKAVSHAKKQGDPLPSDEQIAKDKVAFRKEFLERLGFKDESQTQVRVAPKDAYDVVIDTSTCRDTASRVKVVAQLLQKNPRDDD